MFHTNQYVLASSLEEAYTLNQKKTAKVLGGMIWLKMGHASYQTVIDLSALGLDKIEEKEDEFVIGAMTTLHQLETHAGLEQCYQGAIRESVRHIVGIQLRNLATVGGSVFGRFGFSDVLTCLMALGAVVELYKGGLVPIEEFAVRKPDNDILVAVHLPRTGARTVYKSMRNTKTDFPVLTAAVCHTKESWRIAVGARPGRAALYQLTLPEGSVPDAAQAADAFTYGSNLRGSDRYRRHLAQVLIRRAVKELEEMEG